MRSRVAPGSSLRPAPGLCAVTSWIMLAVIGPREAAPVTAGPDRAVPSDTGVGEWIAYGRDPGGTRYSPLDEIRRGNVGELEVAWTYRTGELSDGRGRFESTPLFVDGVLYVSTPLGRVIALDGATGTERWRYDPGVSPEADYSEITNRGVAYWQDEAATRPCDRRIFVGTIDARLIALDATSGRPCPEFGDGGTIDLTRGLRNPPAYPGEYQVTSPPAVVLDLVIVGSAVADNQRADAPSGEVRAFDARTGAPRWSWDPGAAAERGIAERDPASSGAGVGGANAWSILSVDPERALVFVPTGSPSPDFYGGERPGRNEHANSVVALEARTGEVVWSFQTVHHDLWDYDVPAQPVLFPLRRSGREIPAVAVGTKMGHLFVLHRETGEPLHPVEERPVPPSDVTGEAAWPTQPIPLRPPALAPGRLSPDDAFGATDEERAWCRDRIAELRYEGIFTPPSLEGTVVYPGNIGGMHWGGVAVDPGRGIAVAPTNRLAMAVRLVPRARLDEERSRLEAAELGLQRGTPYAMVREVLLGPGGMPCTPPPWGALTAVELASGEVLWERPLGSMVPPGVGGDMELGAVNLGGAIVTGGGLVFVGATPDGRIRALDVASGELLWSASLPADAHATPMTYRADGRQYVVVAAGGNDRMSAALGRPLSDHLVAFALPEGGSGPSGVGR